METKQPEVKEEEDILSLGLGGMSKKFSLRQRSTIVHFAIKF